MVEVEAEGPAGARSPERSSLVALKIHTSTGSAARTAQPPHLALLEGRQQLGLDGRWERAHLVQEEHPAVGGLKESRAWPGARP